MRRGLGRPAADQRGGHALVGEEVAHRQVGQHLAAAQADDAAGVGLDQVYVVFHQQEGLHPGAALHRPARGLPQGQKKLLDVASAFALKPSVILLDEPTAGMSPEETRGFMDLARALAGERTVVLVEHKMKLVMGISDRVLVLHHGELLAEGTPAEIRADERVRRVYLGQRA